jgi:hypothetical protein
MFILFHTFDFAPAKNFIKKKPPRPRRRPGATGARRSRRFTARTPARLENFQRPRQFGR